MKTPIGRSLSAVALAGCLVILVAMAGCSAESPSGLPGAAPTKTEDEPLTDPTPTPGVVESGPNDAVASLDRFDAFTEVEAGDSIVDPYGNLVAVYAVASIPEGLVVPVDASVEPAQPFAVDVSMCAPGELVDPAGGAGAFSVTGDADSAPVGDGDLSDRTGSAIPLRSPSFVAPGRGQCSRGWVTVEGARGAEPGVARYLARVEGDEGVEEHLYQWTGVGAAVETEADESGDSSVNTVPAGEFLRFVDGALAETDVTVVGWAEVIDVPAPPQARVVAVLVEICPSADRAERALPAVVVGLGHGDWNLPIRFAGLDTPLPDVGLGGACIADWSELVVPFGFVPEVAYVSDGVSPVGGFARWSLEGAALADPDQG